MWQRNSTVDRNGKQNLPRGQISALDRRSGLRVLVFKSNWRVTTVIRADNYAALPGS